MNLKEAEIFLVEVNNIYSKIPKNEKTFMEITKYPHYENVCSNILSFYFNPKEEHSFNDAVFRALLDVIENKSKDIDTNINLTNINVFREYITANGNRIDLVLQNNEIVIGIENKIMSGIYNDLEDYANTIEQINNNAVKILLSLKDETNIAKKNNFINVTYSELFEKIKLRISKYKDNQNKWYIYLIDFMKSIEGYEVEKEMDELINEWLKNHYDDINKFNELLKLAKNGMSKKIKEYGNVLEEKISKRHHVKYWQDSDIQLGAYILLEGIGCNLDALLTVDGWKFGLNIWKKLNRVKIRQALSENGYEVIEDDGEHIYLCKLNYNSSMDEVTKIAKNILEIIEDVE